MSETATLEILLKDAAGNNPPPMSNYLAGAAPKYAQQAAGDSGSGLAALKSMLSRPLAVRVIESVPVKLADLSGLTGSAANITTINNYLSSVAPPAPSAGIPEATGTGKTPEPSQTGSAVLAPPSPLPVFVVNTPLSVEVPRLVEINPNLTMPSAEPPAPSTTGNAAGASTPTPWLSNTMDQSKMAAQNPTSQPMAPILFGSSIPLPLPVSIVASSIAMGGGGAGGGAGNPKDEEKNSGVPKWLDIAKKATGTFASPAVSGSVGASMGGSEAGAAGAIGGVLSGVTSALSAIPGPLGVGVSVATGALQGFSNMIGRATDQEAKNIRFHGEQTARLVGGGDVFGAQMARLEKRVSEQNSVPLIGGIIASLSGDKERLAEIQSRVARLGALEQANNRIAAYSPEVAQAQAQRQTQNILQRLQEARANGPAFAEFEKTQGQRELIQNAILAKTREGEARRAVSEFSPEKTAKDTFRELIEKLDEEIRKKSRGRPDWASFMAPQEVAQRAELIELQKDANRIAREALAAGDGMEDPLLKDLTSLEASAFASFDAIAAKEVYAASKRPNFPIFNP